MKVSSLARKEIDAIRAARADEYARIHIRGPVAAVLKKYGATADELYLDAADHILDEIERAEDKEALAVAQGEGLFALFKATAHVALGDGNRVQRDHMTSNHIARHRRVIIKNLTAVMASSKQRLDWCDEADALLAGYPPETRLIDVLGGPGGTPMPPMPVTPPPPPQPVAR